MVKCQDKEIQHTNSVLKLQGESHIVPVVGPNILLRNVHVLARTSHGRIKLIAM